MPRRESSFFWGMSWQNNPEEDRLYGSHSYRWKDGFAMRRGRLDLFRGRDWKGHVLNCFEKLYLRSSLARVAELPAPRVLWPGEATVRG